MTDTAQQQPLVCDKCGTAPAPFLPAKVGGTHYRIVEHAVGSPGRRPNRNARVCGKWVIRSAP